MRDFISNNKKLLLLLLLLVIALLIVLFSILFILERNKSISQETINENSPSNPPATLSPPLTIEFTGSDEEINQQYLDLHPELQIEAKLKTQVPLSLENFTIDYDYNEDKFVVRLKPPYNRSRSDFSGWMNQIGLTDINRFSIIEE